MKRDRSIAGLRGGIARQRRVLEGLVASWQRRSPEAPSPDGLDPVFLVRRYSRPEDREVAGLVAALFAYGRVDVLCPAVRTVLDALGPSPRAALSGRRHEEAGFAPGFRYRFQTREDLQSLLRAAARMIEREGGLGLSLASRRPGGARGADALDLALARWVRDLRRLAGGRPTDGLRHLLADPALGGASKRWRLYLRWMIRPDDGIDCGAWSDLFSAADLTLPLDTHWIRMAPRLGLASRRTPGARLAREITEGLRRIAPSDPLRYDLPVCHLGIAGGCPVRLTAEDCAACRLRSICTTAQARGNDVHRRPAEERRRGAGARA